MASSGEARLPGTVTAETLPILGTTVDATCLQEAPVSWEARASTLADESAGRTWA